MRTRFLVKDAVFQQFSGKSFFVAAPTWTIRIDLGIKPETEVMKDMTNKNKKFSGAHQ